MSKVFTGRKEKRENFQKSTQCKKIVYLRLSMTQSVNNRMKSRKLLRSLVYQSIVK